MALLGLIIPQGGMVERGDAAAIDAFCNYISYNGTIQANNARPPLLSLKTMGYLPGVWLINGYAILNLVFIPKLYKTTKKTVLLTF